MKQINFNSDEDAEYIGVPSIKTAADTGMRRSRCEVETEVDMDPLQWRTTRSELGILVERHHYTPAPILILLST